MPTITGSSKPRTFEGFEERLIAIAEFRHGLSRDDARRAYHDAIAALGPTALETPPKRETLRSLVQTFHACCSAWEAAMAPETATSRLSSLLRRGDGRRVLRSLARISPRSRREFRILLEKRSDGRA